jgi:hypothetical protein
MGLNERVRKLEDWQPPERCPKCHDNQFAVYVKDSPEPRPCLKCGKTPPFVIQANSTSCQDMVLRLIAGELPDKSDERRAEIDNQERNSEDDQT